MTETIFHRDFVTEPYWWQFFRPCLDQGDDVPVQTSVLIVGGGYTGLSAALAIAKQGIDVTVCEAEEFGFGASTRNGGGVSAGVNIGKTLSGKRVAYEPGEREAILREAGDAFSYIEELIQSEKIDCSWMKPGRFVGAWTPKHFEKLEEGIPALNDYAQSGAFMVGRERQRDELATDLYRGGMVISRSGLLNPALLYKAMLDRCRTAGVRLCPRANVRGLELSSNGWRVVTSSGSATAERVIVATNGYTSAVAPELKRRLVPIDSNIIVTEELPPGLGEELFPTGRMINDTLRIRSYYRLTPDGRRVLFGGRGRFGTGDTRANAQALYRLMLERVPGLRGVKLTHAWSGKVAFTLDSTAHVGEMNGLHYALGCNGSGVAIMSYLGDYIGRKVAGVTKNVSHFERKFPTNRLYRGNPWFLPIIGNWFNVLDKIERRVG